MYTGGKVTDGQVIDNAIITSPVLIANKNVTFNNPTFDGAGIIVTGPTDGLVINNFIAKKVARLVDLSQTNLNFTGSNYLLKNLQINGGTMDGGTILQGNFGNPYNPISWASNISIQKVVYNSSTFGPLVTGAGLFHVDIHDNKITFASIAQSGGDYAIFSISGGNGKIYNNVRFGGWGWLTRFYAASVKGDPQDAEVYGNIDTDKNCYGGVEMRVETPAQLGQFLTGTNLKAHGNRCGNYKDNLNGQIGNYSNNSVLIMAMDPAFTCEITDNVLFNAQSSKYHEVAPGTGVGTQNNYKPTIFSGNTYSAVAPPIPVPPTKQRTVKSYNFDGMKTTFNYDDLTTSTLP